MAREVEDRFASMSEFDQALKGITDQETGKTSRISFTEEVSPPPSRGSRPVPLVSTRSSGGASAPRLEQDQPRGESLSPWKRNVPVWVVALAGCLLVMFLGLFQWFRSPEGSRTAEDPPREARGPTPGKVDPLDTVSAEGPTIPICLRSLAGASGRPGQEDSDPTTESSRAHRRAWSWCGSSRGSS